MLAVIVASILSGGAWGSHGLSLRVHFSDGFSASRAAFSRASLVFLGSARTTGAGTPSQFASLKGCMRQNPINPEDLKGDCAVYSSPNDPTPAVYDGTQKTVYVDPVFGTKIKRLTPQKGMPPGGYAPRYAPHQSWSKDGTYLYLTGPGGNVYLLQGTDPYKYIRQIALPRGDGVDEFWTQWSNTRDCLIIIVNANKVQTINVCENDKLTTLVTLTKLTDTQGNVLPLGGGHGIVIKPFLYCGVSQDDTKIASRVVGDGVAGYGFVLLTLDLGHNTASYQWFHKLTPPGDLVNNNQAPIQKFPGDVCISPDGNYIDVQWNTWSFGLNNQIASAVRTGGTVTLTASAAWVAGITVGSTINVNNSLDPSFNGQFAVVTISDSTHLTCKQSGPDASMTNCLGAPYYNYCGEVDYKYYGAQAWNASTGTILGQISRAEAHSDGMLLADKTAALGGGYLNYVHDDYRGWQAYQFSTGKLFRAYAPEEYIANSTGPQWHFSGRGSVSSDGLPGWGLISTYSETAQVDCNAPGQTIFCAEIMAVKMDGSNTFYRIAHSQSVQCNASNGLCNYYAEPHATPNRTFTKILFGSDWRAYGANVDAYLIELP